ncbi:MAG: hypothetical protein NZL92_11450 [Gloeomargarita sp. SKYG116]|nr:hypothetical protein [Gloeomargarita sp. SKYG116]MDW8402297.1 hypothetical protein [Gloeomargarita sp. SKYGB_i_bin116]
MVPTKAQLEYRWRYRLDYGDVSPSLRTHCLCVLGNWCLGKLLGPNTLGLREYLEGTDKLKLLTYFVGTEIPPDLDLGEMKELHNLDLPARTITRRFRTHCLCILGAWVVRRCREFPDSLEVYLVNSGYIEKIKEFLGGHMPRATKKAEQRIPREKQQRATEAIKHLLQQLEQEEEDSLMLWIKSNAEHLRKLFDKGYKLIEIAEIVKRELEAEASATYLARLIGQVVKTRKRTRKDAVPEPKTKTEGEKDKSDAEISQPAPERPKSETHQPSLREQLFRLSPQPQSHYEGSGLVE